METNSKNQIEKKEVKKVNTITSEKEIADNKKNAIEKSKEALKKKNLSMKDLASLDLETLDLNNLKGLFKDNNVKTKEVTERFQMYKFERLNLDAKEVKRKRTKIRNERNKICDNILSAFVNENKTDLKKNIDKFNVFYKENYLLNDYSLVSICQSNADDETKFRLKSMLEIIKKTK